MKDEMLRDVLKNVRDYIREKEEGRESMYVWMIDRS